jgi:hypothetical protein
LVPLEAWRLWKQRSSLRVLLAHLLRCGMVVVGALMIAASVVIPGAVSLRDSVRGLEAGTSFSYLSPSPPRTLISLISPYFFLRRADFLNWCPEHVIESILIIPRGITVLSLAALTLAAYDLRRRRLKFVWLAIALLLSGLFIATAPECSWHRFVFRWLPGYSMFRAWGRALLVAFVGMLVLTAWISGRLRRSREPDSAPWFAIVISVAVCLSAIIALYAAATISPRGVHEWFRLGREGMSGLYFLPIEQAAAVMIRALNEDFVWYCLYGAAAILGALSAKHAARYPQRTRVQAASAGVIVLLLFVEGYLWQRACWSDRFVPDKNLAAPEMVRWLENEAEKTKPAPLTVAFMDQAHTNYALFFPSVRSLSGADSNLNLEYNQWLNAAQRTRLRHFDTVFGDISTTMIAETGLRCVFTGPDTPPALNFAANLELGQAKGMSLPVLPYAEFVADDDGASSAAQRSVKLKSWRQGSAELELITDSPASLLIREFPDPHWTASLDGQSLRFAASGGMMKFQAPAGRHTLAIRFSDPLPFQAALISAFAMMTYAITGAAWWSLSRSSHRSSISGSV